MQATRARSVGMTLVWFIVWLVADRLGDRAPLTFHPVNVWAGALLLAIAVDLSRQHTGDLHKRDRGRNTEPTPAP